MSNPEQPGSTAPSRLEVLAASSSADTLALGLGLMVPGLAACAFFTVAGLPSIGVVCGLVAAAGWLTLLVGVRWHAAKVDELFRHHVRAQRTPVAPREAAG